MSYQAMKTCRGNINAYNWGEKPIWKGYILYDSNYIAFWKKYSYGIFPNIEYTMLRLNRNVSYRLSVFMTCQCMSLFISDIGLWFSFFVWHFCPVLVSGWWWPHRRSLGSVPSSEIFWKGFRRIGVSSSLNVWWSLPVKPSLFQF